MSLKPLNFDIQNYTINDLKEIFGLPTNFDSNIIEIKETKLRDKLLDNPKFTPKLKQDAIQFIGAAKIKLQEQIKNTRELTNPHPYIIERPIIDENAGFQERVFKKHLNVDTRFRDNFNQSSSDFDINLSYNLTKVTNMELASIEFPTTFYAISEMFENNFFIIKITTVEGIISNAIFELPDGNYSREAITNALNDNTNYHTYDNTNNDIFSIVQFRVDIDNDGSGTGKMIFILNHENSSYDIEQVELMFNQNKNGSSDSKINLTKKLGWMLGFREEMYATDLSNSNFELVSESLLNITGPKYIYVAINDYTSNNENTSNFHSAFNSIILNKNILARIPLTTFSFSFEIANMLTIVSTPRKYTSPTTISKLGVQLLDEYGRILNLNNMNISFCLSFTHSYEN
jgi:hypothetical protein